ncbi:MAG: metal-sensing transcriptional repressor [Clostridiales bacterium]|nr:metal-sensing transcriptional repressor [Clostridiales bacterium]MBQ3107830.1 metal-sensing transcriptional repressor [Bacillota bacterium]
MTEKDCCRFKETARDAALQKSLQNRLNRIMGQLKGIQTMVEENRYCGDILIQVAAAEKALQSFGYLVLQDHMETCVADGIRRGDAEVLEEAIELVKKLK